MRAKLIRIWNKQTYRYKYMKDKRKGKYYVRRVSSNKKWFWDETPKAG